MKDFNMGGHTDFIKMDDCAAEKSTIQILSRGNPIAVMLLQLIFTF